MRWLRERGRGLPVGPVAVPSVPAAVIFDLGNAGKPVGWPGPDDAYRACEQANEDVAEGRIGAGAGATCGKAAGLDKMMPARLGAPATRSGRGDVIVGAPVGVNAGGDVRDARGGVHPGGGH